MLRSIIVVVLGVLDYLWGLIKWFLNIKLKYKLIILFFIVMLIKPLREFVFISFINIFFFIVGVLI